MIEFYSKKERDAFVKDIKDNGLETTLRGYIKDETAKEVLSLVFSLAFDRLSDEDYEIFVNEVCDNITWENDNE